MPNRCGRCEFYDSKRCHLSPPDAVVIEAGTVPTDGAGARHDGSVTYVRPKVEPIDRACGSFKAAP